MTRIRGIFRYSIFSQCWDPTRECGIKFNLRSYMICRGHNKWICGSGYCMYVWEQLHVQGRRISSRARRRQKITDSYPFKNQTRFYRVNFRTFDDLVKSILFAWCKIKKKKSKFRGFSSKIGRSRICSCVHHGPAWSCNMYVCMCGTGVPPTRTHRSTCCGLSTSDLQRQDNLV